MSASPDAPRRGTVRNACGSYARGHDIHFIQWNRSGRNGPGERCWIESVSDDGTITFTDGSTLWIHQPERLQRLLQDDVTPATLRDLGVLLVDGRVFSTADGPSPCPADGGAPRPGETLAEEFARRGGLFLPGPEVLARLEQEQRAED